MTDLVLSTFSGADLFGLAFHQEGFCVVAGPEILFGRDLRGWHVPAGRFGGILGSPPCFAGGTPILAWSGYRPIEEIEAGDRVLTHEGRWRSVTAVHRRDSVPLRLVVGQGVYVETTDEHPFLARRIVRDGDTRRLEPAEWVEAKRLQPELGWAVAQTLPPVRRSPRDEAFWELVGRWLADGWLRFRTVKSRSRGLRRSRPVRAVTGEVILCAGRHKADRLAEQICRAGFHARRVETRTAVKFHIAKNWLARCLAAFGRGAAGKRVPGWVLELDAARCRALLEGYLSGDGHRGASGWVANSVSPALSFGLALLVQRAFGVVASVRLVRTPEECHIEGRRCRQRDYWTLTIPVRNRSGIVEEGDRAWKRLRRNTRSGSGSVYNLSVDEDESYIAGGAIVHNCQSFSPLVHLVRATGHEPKHGNLIPEFERIVSEAAPVWFLMEEVPRAPVPSVAGYAVHDFSLDNCTLDGGDGFGLAQMRKRRFSFGVRGAVPVDLRRWITWAALELPNVSLAVSSHPEEVPVALGGSGKMKTVVSRDRDLVGENGRHDTKTRSVVARELAMSASQDGRVGRWLRAGADPKAPPSRGCPRTG